MASASSDNARASASGRLPTRVRAALPPGYSDVIDFHGHLCPGLTMGYRATVIAMERLGVPVDRAREERLVGIVETDACGVDAFQYLTGCTFGTGALAFRDYGKQAFTLVLRTDGRGVRVAIRPDALAPDPIHTRLRALVTSGTATLAETAAFEERHLDKAMRLLDMPADKLAVVSDVTPDVPPAARVFDTVVCAICGEGVMEPRSRLRGGDVCCVPCSGHDQRGA